MYSVFFKFPVESSTYIYILKNYFPMANTLKLCHLTLEILKQLQLDGCKGNDA